MRWRNAKIIIGFPESLSAIRGQRKVCSRRLPTGTQSGTGGRGCDDVCAMKEKKVAPREMTHLLASCSFAKSASSSCEGGSLGIKVVVTGLLLWLKTSLLLLLLMELEPLLLLLHSLTLRPAAFAVNDNRREQLVRLARRCRTSLCTRIQLCVCVELL